RKIAWRELISYVKPSARHRETSLVFIDAEGGESPLELPDTGPGPDELAMQQMLKDFLDEQLDEILIFTAKTEEQKNTGRLEKMAFRLYYVDGCTQQEIVEAVNDYAAALGMSEAVKQTTVNNWVSRGDTLKKLCRHLIGEHADMIEE